MFIDARTVSTDEVVETHICIMGAGAAGITLAREFIGQPFRVILLESGDFQPDRDTQSLYIGRNVGLPYFPLETARLRFFGGTTNHWSGTCRPFDDIDFEEREAIPFSGWPIRKSDLQPYYERAQSVCQLQSDEWELAYWQKQNPFPALPFVGGRVVSRVAQLVPQSQLRFRKNYRDEIEQANNIITYLNANVTEIETEEAARVVTNVRVATLSGNTFSVKAKIFLLALGGIENPRLLLLSNKTQPEGLGNQHDLVGRFFLEHPRFRAGKIIPAYRHLSTEFYQGHTVDETPLKAYLSLTEETLRREGLVDVQVRLEPVYHDSYYESRQTSEVAALRKLATNLRSGKELDDFGKHVTNVMADLMSWQEYFTPMAPLPLPKAEVISKLVQAKPEEREHLISEFLGDIAYVAYGHASGSKPLSHIELVTRIDPVPNPDSRITLDSERDQLGNNRVQLDWRLSPLDKYSVRRTLEIMGAELGHAGLGRLQIDFDDSDATWPSDLAGGWHHMGTTRMSQDPSQGVVDKNCQVHGISNLFIAGGSVFPTGGSGTPTLTLVSLALRLADHIKEKMR